MWWEGGGDVIFNITEGGLELIFLFGGGVLSKFLLDNSSLSASPPDNYCTVPYLGVRSFGMIRIRISDPRSLRSWQVK